MSEPKYDLRSITALPGVISAAADGVVVAKIRAACKDELSKIIPARLARLTDPDSEGHIRVAVCLRGPIPMHNHQETAEAAIAKAKAMINEGKTTTVEMDRVMTDGSQQYTRSVGGTFSAKTEAEFMLKETLREIPVLDDAFDFLVEEAAKLGFEL